MTEIDIQPIRKRNLQLVIDQYAGGSVDQFSKDIEKHRTYVYAMLKQMDENNPRAITSKMARMIETHYGMPLLTLDNSNYKNDIPGLTTVEEKNIPIAKISFNLEGDKFILDLKDAQYIVAPSIINGHNVYSYEVENDLMAPKIEKQSTVFIEYIDKFIIKDLNNGAIYLIGYNKKIYLVRIFVEFNNSIRLRIDNPLHQNIFPEISMDFEKFSSFVQVFGRVIGNMIFSGEYI